MARKTLEELKAEFNVARERARRERTPETREAAKAAWAAVEAVAPRRKVRGGFACRAGKRQADERRAMTLAAQREAARRR